MINSLRYCFVFLGDFHSWGFRNVLMSFLMLSVILKKALVELCLVIIQMMEVYGFFIFRECLIMMESFYFVCLMCFKSL